MVQNSRFNKVDIGCNHSVLIVTWLQPVIDKSVFKKDIPYKSILLWIAKFVYLLAPKNGSGKFKCSNVLALYEFHYWDFSKNSINLPYANFGLFYFISVIFGAKIAKKIALIKAKNSHKANIWLLWILANAIFFQIKSRIRQGPSVL